MTEYKEQCRGLKASMTDKDKQLDLAKRTIERLSGHCNAMEVPQHLRSSLKLTSDLPCLPNLTCATRVVTCHCCLDIVLLAPIDQGGHICAVVDRLR